MRRSFCALLMFALSAGLANAQYGQPYATGPSGAFRPQTAMGALGQTGVLRLGAGDPTARGPATRRVAAQAGLPSGQASMPRTKPFSGVTSTPTISPYLNLFREESGDAAPNYFAFVRPQQQQYEASRQQQEQLNQLQRQVRQASYSAPATGGSGAARYGDTSRFYRGWQR